MYTCRFRLPKQTTFDWRDSVDAGELESAVYRESRSGQKPSPPQGRGSLPERDRAGGRVCCISRAGIEQPGPESRVRGRLLGRPNIWAVRSGEGGGPTLLMMGHTDTVHARGWQERWSGTEREDPFGAAEVDGAIWGRGAADLKAGICAAKGALELLQRACVRLRGDLVFAFVGDEESGEPGTGVSAGARALMEEIRSGGIPRPDFAIYTEPTRLSVFTAQMGFFIADLRMVGKSAYFL